MLHTESICFTKKGLNTDTIVFELADKRGTQEERKTRIINVGSHSLMYMDECGSMLLGREITQFINMMSIQWLSILT